ncbi:MBL fold metallo-hydrolase [Nocardia miyunensis]|uniref:MBL fold metallo-hydrolase n=1 Tax=Nocardia miyunensis TaxID=282684 RepID=UPI000830E182|nr:MBL fold metallo-hydrolase [Nocardia miyunensis]
MATNLSYDVLIADPIPQNVDALVPNGDHYMWSPQSTTLIFGEHQAVLVDPPFTTKQVHDVIDWVRSSGRNLTHIYITHGHGDHWFTAGVLADRFHARVVATAGTIELMHREVANREALWDKLFPGQIPAAEVTATPPEDNHITLEGHSLWAVEVGHSDTDDTTVLHVPSLDLVVGGDVIYNGVHQYLAESAGGGLRKWLEAVDVVESLEPLRIVAGHKDRNLDDAGPRAITQTRDYLRSAEELRAGCGTAREFFSAMSERYPTRLNPTALWMGATALYR